jgi:hypothetical protein
MDKMQNVANIFNYRNPPGAKGKYLIGKWLIPATITSEAVIRECGYMQFNIVAGFDFSSLLLPVNLFQPEPRKYVDEQIAVMNGVDHE